ncbi:MAG: tetratricopeptide repeat protein [Deltaproteobacteria bacterium]|nr:tetratricopeptide repeat protein [Deltaproteobacteria bacterium]
MSSKARKAFDEGVRAAARNDRTAAEASFQTALDRDANAYPALYNLGVLADRQGNEQDATSYYQRALRLLPDYEPAVRGISTIQIRRNQVRRSSRSPTSTALISRYRRCTPKCWSRPDASTRHGWPRGARSSATSGSCRH